MKNTIFVAFICILMCACSSAGKHTLDNKQSDLKPSYDSFYVEVLPGATDITPDKINDIRAMVVEQIMISGRFQHIITEKEKADIDMSINLTKYREVSPFLKSLLWMAAGSNQIGGHITVSKGNGTPIMQYEAIGKSAAHPLSGESDYYYALKQFSYQVMTGLGG